VTDERTLLELSRADGLRLIASVPVGRLVFTQHALPAIRPVNHIVEDDMLVIGLTAGSPIAASARGGIVVAYEADSLDVTERSGWSVVVVGVARLETDATTVLRYRDQLRPWLSGAMADILTISSELVTGYRLAP
jgi:nitroimidazol reductase NimA-like FMN-containing flavoprotein (pyridoxamine 5'-phosphate oxidase superfamily)